MLELIIVTIIMGKEIQRYFGIQVISEDKK